jgi:ribosomal protein S18 acetylase RimI-like enzyme
MKFKIKKMRPKDGRHLCEIVKATGVFSKNELKIADELIHSCAKNPWQKDYTIYLAENEKRKIAGYICFGPTPCTENTYDIYWIAVDPGLHGHGIGSSLLDFAENKIIKNNGKIIVVETSSTKKYEKTRNFYLGKDYKTEAKIKNFYRNKDDKIIFIKRIRKTIV